MSALADHLWQSTWFVCAAWLVTLLFRSDARARYWIWFAASLKFLVPFSLLTAFGRQFVWQVDETAFLPLVQHVAVPLTTTVVTLEPFEGRIVNVLLAIWGAGTLALFCRWTLQWLRLRKVIRESAPCQLEAPFAIRCTGALSEPGIVGIVHPMMLVSPHLLSTLTSAELDAVIAHEAWHVRRRDNLTAAVHALIEALFWFHPLVWWIGAKLIETREQACDDGALEEGAEPATYAGAILRVCRYSLESREACLARATGGDLTARIRAIMSGRGPSRFPVVRQTLAAVLLATCIVLPVTAGITVIAISQLQVPAGARSIWLSEGNEPAFVAVQKDYLYARNVSLRQLISRAYAIDEFNVDGNLPWLDRPRYNVELRAPQNVSIEQLVAQLLKQQFNLELVVRPTVRARQSTGLDL